MPPHKPEALAVHQALGNSLTGASSLYWCVTKKMPASETAADIFSFSTLAALDPSQNHRATATADVAVAPVTTLLVTVAKVAD